MIRSSKPQDYSSYAIIINLKNPEFSKKMPLALVTSFFLGRRLENFVILVHCVETGLTEQFDIKVGDLSGLEEELRKLAALVEPPYEEIINERI